jgi:hypothetical protein
MALNSREVLLSGDTEGGSGARAQMGILFSMYSSVSQCRGTRRHRVTDQEGFVVGRVRRQSRCQGFKDITAASRDSPQLEADNGHMLVAHGEVDMIAVILYWHYLA